MSEQKNVKYKYSGDADKLGYIAQLTADNARLRKAIEEHRKELGEDMIFDIDSKLYNALEEK